MKIKDTRFNFRLAGVNVSFTPTDENGDEIEDLKDLLSYAMMTGQIVAHSEQESRESGVSPTLAPAHMPAPSLAPAAINGLGNRTSTAHAPAPAPVQEQIVWGELHGEPVLWITPEQFGNQSLEWAQNEAAGILCAAKFNDCQMEKNGRGGFYFLGRKYPDIVAPAGKWHEQFVGRGGVVVFQRGKEKRNGGFYLDYVNAYQIAS